MTYRLCQRDKHKGLSVACRTFSVVPIQSSQPVRRFDAAQVVTPCPLRIFLSVRRLYSRRRSLPSHTPISALAETAPQYHTTAANSATRYRKLTGSQSLPRKRQRHVKQPISHLRPSQLSVNAKHHLALYDIVRRGCRLGMIFEDDVLLRGQFLFRLRQVIDGLRVQGAPSPCLDKPVMAATGSPSTS